MFASSRHFQKLPQAFSLKSPHRSLKGRQRNAFARATPQGSYSPPHNPDLLLRQSIQLVDQGVYLPVSRLDLALQGRMLLKASSIVGLPVKTFIVMSS
jgi:hypothetical protein